MDQHSYVLLALRIPTLDRSRTYVPAAVRFAENITCSLNIIIDTL